MAGDPEKRLQKALDKLYQAHKSSLQLSGKSVEMGALRGSGVDKRVRISNAVASAGSLGLAPPCRPWDRGDLMRRLATFKAMTWFGKPKAVSPVNCARRGWVNIEMDVIACEACGARLLFSIPSSWTMQQVEKAAAVFSLKLDNGHKLLCPWIDNTCDEALALFPPTPPGELVESYKYRSSKLLRFSALPVISSSTIEYMKTKSPQLECFLSQLSYSSVNLPNGIRLIDASKSIDIEGAFGTEADLYYQAHKIISLCGWEPRLLPYVVDCEDQTTPLIVDAAASESSVLILRGQKDNITVSSASILSEIQGGDHGDPNHSDYQYDPASVVFDCRFCGACVALWGFASIQRPLEVYSLVTGSHTETKLAVSDEALAGSVEALETESSHFRTKSLDKIGVTSFHDFAAKEKPLELNLTIAGGPPPTKQNFRPRVSFPIVSRHLRAVTSSSRKYGSFESLCGYQVDNQCLLQDVNPSQDQIDINDGAVVSEVSGSLKRKRSDSVNIASTRCDFNAQSHFEGDLPGMPTSPGGNSSSEVKDCSKNGNYSSNKSSDAQNQEDMTGKSLEVFCEGAIDYEGDERGEGQEKAPEKTEKFKGVNSSDIMNMDSGAIIAFKDSNSHENDPIKELADISTQHNNETSRTGSVLNNQPSSSGYPFNGASSSDNNAGLCTQNLNSDKGKNKSNAQNVGTEKKSNQSSCEMRDTVSPSISNVNARHAHGKKPYCRSNEFDAIKHHRPYCPWVSPDDGETLPGWRVTLFAILNQEDSSTPSKADTSTNLLDEIDDPVVSVRKLFMSPSSKRLKTRH